MIMRTSSGVDLNSNDKIITFTPTDLPEPVVPATRRCGIFARSATTGTPAMSLPNTIAKSDGLLANFFAPITSERRTISRC